MLFTTDAHAGLAAGTITTTFRLWTRAQVRVGGTYRIGDSGIALRVDRLERVRLGELTDEDAVLAGCGDLAGLTRLLGRGGRRVEEDTLLWRVDFHRVAPPPATVDDQAEPGPEELALLTARLARMDRAGGGLRLAKPKPAAREAEAWRPWTLATLKLLAARPGVVSTELAAELGRERAALKADVVKLKRLGLTRSLRVGYELSPRGRALLDHLTGRSGAAGPSPPGR
jgi:hypothetical protein